MYYEYTKYISKNKLHWLKNSRAKIKVVKVYARVDSDLCLVRLLDMYMYLHLLPPDSTYLYMRPCRLFPTDSSKPAYCRQRIDISQLKKFVYAISSQVGNSGYTNHCLRATAMTHMYTQGVPEKVIANKS